MRENISIERLVSMKSLHQMQQVEEEVWQMSANPVHQTYTASKNGGVLLGAFDGAKMIGFLYSFAGFNGSHSYLCSHMLGILPDYRKIGLGKQMKRKQAEIARELGYTMITWTFDPLESRNAYLNLHKLGATGVYYKQNYYGSMHDQLNQGLPTDRIQIEWYINETASVLNPKVDANRILIDTNEKGIPVSKWDSFTSDKDAWFVAIPENFQSLKRTNIELAIKWRQLTSEGFQFLFDQGYKAKDLVRDQSRQVSYYYFSK